MILAACGEDPSPAGTMTATTTMATMTQTSDPSGDPTPGDPSGDPTPTDPGESSDSAPDDTTSAPVPGAPIFVSLQTNVSTVTAGETVTFTAVLTDPDGVDDILGGTLSDPTGMIGYGPFVAAGQKGTYSISVSWDSMHQAEPIEFEDMSVMRSFRAEFFDQAANKVSKDGDLTLACAEGAACGGVCTDLMKTAEHCGACGKSCASGCKDGGCAPAFGECVRFDEGFDTCDQICGASGQTCVENGCGKGWTVRGFSGDLDCMNDELETDFVEPCGAIQPWNIDRFVVKCCCTVDP